MGELKQVYEGGKLKYIREQLGDQVIIKFSGIFQEMNDVRNNKNRNGRIYNKKLWENIFADANMLERLNSRRMLGELDHPNDDGQVRRTSHIVTELRPDWDAGLVYGTLELLNHDQGDAALLRALVEQGMQVCVSSRGFGDYLDDGCTIDPESFKLITFDIVLDPSVPVAKLNQVAEKLNESLADESKAHYFKVPLVDKNEKTNIKEMGSMKELIESMEKASKLEVALAKNEVHLENMKSLLNDKNEALAKNEASYRKTLESLESDLKKAKEDIAALKKENDDLKADKDDAEKTVESYNAIEAKAIKVIEGLRAKLAEHESLGERAASVIENLTARLRMKEDLDADKPPVDADDLDKDSGKADGDLRDSTPGGKGGDDLETAKSEGKKKKEQDGDEDDDLEEEGEEGEEDEKDIKESRKIMRKSLLESAARDLAPRAGK